MIFYFLGSVITVLTFIFLKFYVKTRILIKGYEREGESYTFFRPILGYFKIPHESFDEYRDYSFLFHKISKENPKLKYMITNLFDRPYIIFIDPEMQKNFYVENAHLYEKFNLGVDNFVRLFGASMPFVEGDDWKKRRVLFTKVFNFNFLNAIFPRVLNACEEIFGNYSENDHVDILTETQKYSSLIIMRSFFASNFHEKVINGIPLIKITVTLLQEISLQTMTLGYLLFGTKFLSLGIRKKDRVINHQLKLFKSAVYEEVKRRIEELQNNKDLETEPTDMLKILFENNNVSEKGDLTTYSYDELVSEFSTFFIAGTDTTSHLIAMILYYLVANQKCLEKLLDEIKDIELETLTHKKANSLVYLSAVIKEVSRIYGPGTGIFVREAKKDNYCGNLLIKKGTLVNNGAIFNNLNPSHYKDPLEFRPERWITEGRDEYVKKNPYLYLPFSGGKRNCIGQHLATMETQAAIIFILKKYEIGMVEGYKMELCSKFLAEPHDPFKLVIKRKIK